PVRQNTGKRGAIGTQDLRRALRTEDLPEPWASRQEARNEGVARSVAALHRGLSTEPRCSLHRANPTCRAGMASLKQSAKGVASPARRSAPRGSRSHNCVATRLLPQSDIRREVAHQCGELREVE